MGLRCDGTAFFCRQRAITVIDTQREDMQPIPHFYCIQS
jgi:hypothetical protein